jgi:hypothetical protein
MKENEVPELHSFAFRQKKKTGKPDGNSNISCVLFVFCCLTLKTKRSVVPLVLRRHLGPYSYLRHVNGKDFYATLSTH